MIGGLLIPMAIILLTNVVIFVLVMYRLSKTVRARDTTTDKTSPRQKAVRRLRNAMCVFVLLGLTWVFGYFITISGGSLVAHVIFIVLNSFQGFFIFVFYVIGQRQSWFGCRWGSNVLGVKVPWRLSYSISTPSSRMTSSTSEAASVYRPSRTEAESSFGITPDPSCESNLRKTTQASDDFYPLGQSTVEEGTDPVSEAVPEDDSAASNDSGMDNEYD